MAKNMKEYEIVQALYYKSCDGCCFLNRMGEYCPDGAFAICKPGEVVFREKLYNVPYVSFEVEIDE